MAQILSNLPIGAKVKFGKHQIASETAQPIIWVVAAKNHSGYPSNSVTLLAQKIIDVRPFDASETDNSRGNNNYELSNINQWLNSFGDAEKWYSPKHSTDTAPYYQSRPGFLKNFTENERNAILPTTLTSTDKAGVTSSMTTNVFLLSTSESVVNTDARLEYFKSNVSTALLTEQAFNNASSKPNLITHTFRYFTRSTSGYSVLLVDPDGGTEESNPASDWGIRPCINLSATAKISNAPGTDGYYTFEVNKLPTITGTNSDLGSKTSGFSYGYTIADGDNEAVTVTEYIDNVKLRSYVASLNTATNFAVTGNTWLKLANGTHTLKITATDGFDTVTRVVTFTRVIDKIVVQKTTPIAATARPSQIIVTLVKNIPHNALLTVEVCNNGFDANPTWETLEASSISSGLAHSFTNKVNTAGKWGVNIRVTVDRNGGEGACYISEIGGNFE